MEPDPHNAACQVTQRAHHSWTEVNLKAKA
eukprot:COSAG02_NODE_14628_length_1253_cov_1.184575_3_plen_29_part_01